jgi:hypothetical protein
MATKEIWREVDGYEGLYQVSNFGRVKSLPRATTSGKILKIQINPKNKYCYVGLCRDNKKASKRVHILVANAFLGTNPNKLQVNHKDGNKANNKVSNLEYCTQSENMKHAYLIGLEKRKGLQVIDLDTLKIYPTATETARAIFGKNGGGEMIARVCRGERSHYRNKRFAFYSDYLYGCIPKYKGKCKKGASVKLWR